MFRWGGSRYWQCEFCGMFLDVAPGIPRSEVWCRYCVRGYVDCGDFRLLVRDERF